MRRATGVLKEFNDAGVLSAADVHVAMRVAALSKGDVGDEVLLASALAVRAVRTGSTCLELRRVDELAADHADDDLRWPTAEAMVAALTSSALVVGGDAGPLRPLALAESEDGPLLYLQKYFRQESTIRKILTDRVATRPTVDVERLRAAMREVFHAVDPMAQTQNGELFYNRQFSAAVLAATSWTTVLAGGPGTGKTYTVARVLHVLELLGGESLRIGLCAPTGRAAAQLQSSVTDYGRLPAGTSAVTVHRLLGSRPDGTFRHGPSNRLPYDVVVVDETSMLPMTMMSRLIASLRSDTRLILVGDPHQLASVEAGAVLADLVARDASGPSNPIFDQVALTGRGDFSVEERRVLADGVITLARGHRFGEQIGDVADAVNAGDAEKVLAYAADPAYDRITMVDPADLDGVRDDVLAWARELHDTAAVGDASGALNALDRHRVLCAHRDGGSGVGGWSRRIVEWISTVDGYQHVSLETANWYAGQPLLVTANDRQNDIYNGDSGVVVTSGNGAGGTGSGGRGTTAVFRRGKKIKELHPSQLGDAMPVYAMTIHRSQGSQFDVVTVVLPPERSELLTRELLYTALTRAKERVRIVGTPESLRAAVSRRVQRASGLRGEVTAIEVPPLAE
ncbi:exodeoxyribonuclease V subunit alpha [Gordonia sp. TBRC 11910]|uniref:RecBCD enzyme subunit RecD n=1 Tax=Gordonia asplenii TaxID=2725283 RepID=A0A848KQY4_9ACTN|nr:exodeoxyribonuclease V subunit alpha [Gordonia asplenii]NMO00337.1 exodeoxyribonuclease V subunit alpha [Gordonia asplenii]